MAPRVRNALLRSQQELGERFLRDAYGRFPTGVTALCCALDGTPLGMAASSFTSVSLDPPFVLVCIANSSTTWPRMRRSPAVGISVLSEEHDTVCRSLAGAASERFRGIPWEESAGGAVFIPGAAARLDCAVEREIPAGDHHIVLLRVHAAAIDTQAAPLVFHASGFRQLQSAGVG